MKHFIKKSLVLFAIIIAALVPTVSFNSTPVYASPCDEMGDPDLRVKYGCGDPCKSICQGSQSSDCDSCKAKYSSEYASSTPTTSTTGVLGSCRMFIGLTSWDCNVDIHDETSLKNSIWQIIVNISTDLTVIAAYLILGFVLYGGYLYIFSGGDPNKVASGKKTLTHAFIGLAIVMSANIIMNTIRIALIGRTNFGACATSDCLSNTDIITNVIQWVVGVGGVVALIFVVYGGISYTISGGDPGKVQAAKNMIMYALIGLAIVALAEVITAFVANTIRDANTNNSSSITSETIIAKEFYEN